MATATFFKKKKKRREKGKEREERGKKRVGRIINVELSIGGSKAGRSILYGGQRDIESN